VLPYSLTACDLSLVSVDVGLDSLVAPSKLYSALAAGRPVAVICSEQSYLRQLIAKGKCGISVNNGDSQGLTDFIRWLAHHQESAEEMGQASRHYLESYFTPKIIAEEYLQLLIEALN
jgi:glycosyltransferase involved in cell wall biosynthesis